MATGERPNAPDRIRTSASQGRRAMSQVRTLEGPDAPDRIRTSASQGRRTMSQVRTLEGPDAPDRIRTCDLWFRRPALYPTELRARDRGRTPRADDCMESPQ